jgi:hypothetical protein
MPTLKEVIIKILAVPARKKTYYKRLARYRNLSHFVPDHYTNIIIEDNGPWFAHGLAFRMATFSSASENVFQRLNATRCKFNIIHSNCK